MGSLLSWVVALMLGVSVVLLLLAVGAPIEGAFGFALLFGAGSAWMTWPRPDAERRRREQKDAAVLFQPTENDRDWRG